MPPRARTPENAVAASLRSAGRFVAGLAFVAALTAPTAALAAPQRPAQPGSVASGRTPQEIYDHAMKMLKRGLYDKAEIDFQELRNFHRDDPLSVRARLGVGDMHFQQGEYEEARFAYEEFASYHPRHPDMDYVTYRIGLCHWKRAPRIAGRDQGTTRAAYMQWANFERRFPGSEWVDEVTDLRQKAIDRLAAKELWVMRFYEKRSAWTAVDRRARSLIDRYPDSRHVEEALGALAIAAWNTGRALDSGAAADKLRASYPESIWLSRIARAQREPLGTAPDDVTFVRPYRISGM